MLDTITGFHIEPTNICTLKCPRCSRTKFIEKFPTKWRNQQLNLAHFKNFIDIDVTGKTFSLCGDIGDPIYYEDLFPLIQWIKSSNGIVDLHTNGSYRTRSWWKQLVSLLDKTDSVTFAIDGLPENFAQYRINADWDSIQIGIEETTKVVTTIWQYIPFGYNINCIEDARQLSRDLGFTHFYVRASSRWDSDSDPYRPPPEFVKSGDVEIKWRKNIVADAIDPVCKNNNNQHFITSSGFYTPCCHIATYNFYYKTEFYKNKDRYDISKTTLSKVLETAQDFYNTLENAKHLACTYSCPKL
jgi:hypothetical protein